MSLDTSDPTDFEGVLPVIPVGEPRPKKDGKTSAATGASAAGVRAFTAQAVAFYFRTPVKAFFRTRVDYLAYARSLSPEYRKGRFTWRTTTPGLLFNAVSNYGWRFIPEQVMPPLIANVTIGAVLYTSYLQILSQLHEPSSHAAKVVFPPPPPGDTFTAGFAAGGLQSLVAAPLDALQVRFERREAHYENKTMWQYGKGKLLDIGVRGVFAGWSLSFLKDSFGSGVFFMTFEYIKAQAYYKFVRYYYGGLDLHLVDFLARKRGTPTSEDRSQAVIKPHYAIEPIFIMLAGMAATISQQAVLYPLSLLQTRHFERLEDLDKQAKQLQGTPSRGRMLAAYYHAYGRTWNICQNEALEAGGIMKWMFRGFWMNTIKQVPSTSAGLIIFELVRRRYGNAGDEVKISEDGYEILLS